MNLSSITPSISTTASTGSFGMIEVNSDLTFIRRKFNTSNGTHVFTVGNTYYLTLQCSQSAGSYAAYVQNAKITASMSVKYIPA